MCIKPLINKPVVEDREIGGSEWVVVGGGVLSLAAHYLPRYAFVPYILIIFTLTLNSPFAIWPTPNETHLY